MRIVTIMMSSGTALVINTDFFLCVPDAVLFRVISVKDVVFCV